MNASFSNLSSINRKELSTADIRQNSSNVNQSNLNDIDKRINSYRINQSIPKSDRESEINFLKSHQIRKKRKMNEDFNEITDNFNLSNLNDMDKCINSQGINQSDLNRNRKTKRNDSGEESEISFLEYPKVHIRKKMKLYDDVNELADLLLSTTMSSDPHLYDNSLDSFINEILHIELNGGHTDEKNKMAYILNCCVAHPPMRPFFTEFISKSVPPGLIKDLKMWLKNFSRNNHIQKIDHHLKLSAIEWLLNDIIIPRDIFSCSPLCKKALLYLEASTKKYENSFEEAIKICQKVISINKFPEGYLYLNDGGFYDCFKRNIIKITGKGFWNFLKGSGKHNLEKILDLYLNLIPEYQHFFLCLEFWEEFKCIGDIETRLSLFSLKNHLHIVSEINNQKRDSDDSIVYSLIEKFYEWYLTLQDEFSNSFKESNISKGFDWLREADNQWVTNNNMIASRELIFEIFFRDFNFNTLDFLTKLNEEEKLFCDFIRICKGEIFEKDQIYRVFALIRGYKNQLCRFALSIFTPFINFFKKENDLNNLLILANLLIINFPRENYAQYLEEKVILELIKPYINNNEDSSAEIESNLKTYFHNNNLPEHYFNSFLFRILLKRKRNEEKKL